MKPSRNKARPLVAFIPIGIALMVVGMNSNAGLIGAGVVFLIIGIAGVSRNRKSQGSGDEPRE